MDLMLQPLRKYADFNGRARRSEYWLFALFVALVQMAAGILSWFVGGDLSRDAFATPASAVIALIYFGFCLYILIPSLAVSFRRLHDSGRTAWWLLLGLIPILGQLVLLIFMILDGTPGDNRYGASPKGPASPEAQPAT
ncbi:MAG: DUF805 domain-containing protein [Phenylobacterium sp.]|uniref:DUF805 domain-containing protein n=1 Tax=Phenylobacterium ferrooxidans TaxID=2982689 RepID=A0ABW6CNE6_9CAUL|nr:DUF805 domain-containing protein [Phenylobacterium sp.]MDO8913046.1 DUF805 domain-containing protein [Phenylobacterium sp.]MDP2009173.1 DUF805 domain-containing protein [Phenylobacterium sp.]MDP3101004.1 DUF805 domain-containing protein [Phenylobacterium sp.]MDP3632537.1 DUF805 domain-containing protein [Phenylobacterium sp.]MDP3870789.1 DUF805 domain-containing protein [Phenylobacterium sp.]